MTISDTTLSKVLKSVRVYTPIIRDALKAAELGPEIEAPVLTAVAVPTCQPI